jgi:two-component system cell cycle sensor histidine kinase/response regulator CckA
VPPKTCLIVDDESSVRAYVRVVLEQEQFRTFEAEDGIQALRLVEKLGDALDLIVSDINMPNGDGVTFVCCVRELFPVLPIILISGYTDQELHSSIFFEFVRKPFLPVTLLTAIDNATKMMKLRTRREL